MSEGERERWEQERNFSAQRALILDEASGLLASAGRDYNAGLIESLMRFYDCGPLYTRSTKSQGRVTVSNAYLNALMASTPRAMAPHLGSERLWAMGYFPRHALLTPEVDCPEWAEPTNDGGGPGNDVIWPLSQLYTRLPKPTWPEPVTSQPVLLAPGVMDLWTTYCRALSYGLLRDTGLDERLFGTYGRMLTQAIKVATILAAFDWSSGGGNGGVTIGLPHLHRAIAICETWRASAHRTIEGGAIAEDNVKLTRVIRQVGRLGPDRATLRELGKSMQDIPRKDLERLLELALASEEVVAVAASPGPKGGRPTQKYRLPIE